MPDAVELSIVIPAYQEAATLALNLQRLAQWLRTHAYGQVEVIVVAADSPDGTVALAASCAPLFSNFRVIRAGRRVGKGRDVRLGMLEARGRYRLFMDADLATPLRHLDDVASLMQRGGQVGIAVRDLFGIHKDLTRKLISKFSNLIIQLVVLPGIKDTQCGFKVFEATAAEEIFSRQTIMTWSFDVEILAIARHLGYKIETFETPDWHDPKAETAGLVGDSPFKVALTEALDPLKVRWGLISGRYNRKPLAGNRADQT